MEPSLLPDDGPVRIVIRDMDVLILEMALRRAGLLPDVEEAEPTEDDEWVAFEAEMRADNRRHTEHMTRVAAAAMSWGAYQARMAALDAELQDAEEEWQRTH